MMLASRPIRKEAGGPIPLSPTSSRRRRRASPTLPTIQSISAASRIPTRMSALSDLEPASSIGSALTTAARWRGRIGKVAAAPGVGVERAIRRHDDMADIAEIVGKHRGAKTRRKGEAAGVALARRLLRRSISARRAGASGYTGNRRQNRQRRGDDKLTPSQPLTGIVITAPSTDGGRSNDPEP
jgi:hypothetical protein